MRRQGWLCILIVLVFGTTLLLAVAKVRSPQVMFDRIAIGMPEDELDVLLGEKPEPVHAFSSAAGGTFTARFYTVGMYEIQVLSREGSVYQKSIRFVPSPIWPERPVALPKLPKSSIAMPPPKQ